MTIPDQLNRHALRPQVAQSLTSERRPMQIGPLALFHKTNSARSFNIASWHSPHSLTWSWILSVSFDGIWRYPPPPLATRKGLRLGFHPFRTNGGLQWVLTFPFVLFHWHRQRPMWFRDLHARRRDECEALEVANSQLRRQMREQRDLAKAAPMGPVQ